MKDLAERTFFGNYSQFEFKVNLSHGSTPKYSRPFVCLCRLLASKPLVLPLNMLESATDPPEHTKCFKVLVTFLTSSILLRLERFQLKQNRSSTSFSDAFFCERHSSSTEIGLSPRSAMKCLLWEALCLKLHSCESNQLPNTKKKQWHERAAIIVSKELFTHS